MQQPFDLLVNRIARLLVRSGMKIVFAESCTAGLISASLARVPGISNHHCGSAVVYRLDTKTKWLGVPKAILIDPGPVSEPVAKAMAEGVLATTPEADMAVSITGHLGPDAPAEQDGLIFVGVAVRGGSCVVYEHHLPAFTNLAATCPFPGESVREQRQWAAVEFALTQAELILCKRANSPHDTPANEIAD